VARKNRPHLAREINFRRACLGRFCVCSIRARRDQAGNREAKSVRKFFFE
jgi:hypothetical protein